MSIALNRIFPILLTAILSIYMLPVYAQSNIKKDQSFNVVLEIDKKGKPVITSFHDPNGHRLKVEIVDAPSLVNLGLQTATIIEGSLHVTSFASAGGLGTTRSGDGRGILEIDLMKDKHGNELKCADDCATGHKVNFSIQ